MNNDRISFCVACLNQKTDSANEEEDPCLLSIYCLLLNVNIDQPRIQIRFCQRCRVCLKEVGEFQRVCQRSYQELIKGPASPQNNVSIQDFEISLIKAESDEVGCTQDSNDLFTGPDLDPEGDVLKLKEDHETDQGTLLVVPGLKSDTSLKSRKFSCPHCPHVKVLTPEGLQRHLRLYHSPTKPNTFEFNCDTCNKHFIKRDALESHILRVHVPPQLAYQCDICSKRFNTRYYLEKHMRYNHLPHFCKFCNKLLHNITDVEFQAHIEQEKQNVTIKPKEICDVCGGEFLNLKHHRKIHFPKLKRNDKVFCCPDCDLTFSNKYNMSSHITRMHKPKHLKCPDCDKMFPTSKYLKQHVIVTHKTVACEYCGKDIRVRQLRDHVNNVHKQVKRYECGSCGSKFADFERVKEHSYMHSSVKRLNCHICERGFSDMRSMKAHYFNVHGVDKEQAPKLCVRKPPDVPDGTYIKID